MWTFKIREGMAFSDGEEILPSTFAALVGAGLRPGLRRRLQLPVQLHPGRRREARRQADTLAGVVADDEAMTLTVTLAAPYSNFPAVAGFQLFFPMPEGAGDDAGRLRERR